MGAIASKHDMNLVIEKATAGDIPAIEAIVDAAYSTYIDRLGKLPAAMTADYAALLRTQDVHVLKVGGKVVGSVLIARDTDSIKVSNLVVDPTAQGRGYGRVLMEFAEQAARSAGLPAVTLFTNEKMHENITLYTRIGFIQTGRRVEEGFNRIYFRKQVSNS